MFSTSVAHTQKKTLAGTLLILISPDDNGLHSQVTIMANHFQEGERIHNPSLAQRNLQANKAADRGGAKDTFTGANLGD